MANIFPFRAWRFSGDAGELSTLVCPPYDIISEEQRKAYLTRNPHNIIRLELPREGADPYAEAGKTVREWCTDGTLVRDNEAAFYVYDIVFEVNGEQKNITGILAAVEISPFSEGVVLPHEWTLSKAKTDRLNLMKATGFNFSDIYSLYQADITSILDDTMTTAPLSDIVDEDGLRHRLWAITDSETVKAIQNTFADNVKLYIADGHHRYETALNYKNYRLENGIPVNGADRVMMMLVDMSHPGLVVFPTHRLLRDLDNFDVNALLDACEADFDVERGLSLDDANAKLQKAYDDAKKAFVVYADKSASLLTLKDIALMDTLLPEESPVSRQLDVNVLHTAILERLLGIDKENMAQQINLTYTKITEEAVEGVDNGTYQCAILLNPTRVSEIQGVAAAGEKMPQKSTYFYPKLITGLTMNELD